MSKLTDFKAKTKVEVVAKILGTTAGSLVENGMKKTKLQDNH
jgi:hypothetical protein